MILGTQYYRPPFPENRFWKKDLKDIKETGLDTIMLWVNWAWVESTPGKFDFDDYDEIMNLAHEHGLKVVLSTTAELQPYWIHRIIEGSEMIDNMGHKVISSNRGESNQGLTPGGCFDNPEVLARMEIFLRKTVVRYRDHPALIGWDAWNETRWEVGSDGLVCYCPYTLQLFREWLDQKYGGLEGLNKAWKRRYDIWEDVMPGKTYNRTYSELIDWALFFIWRQNRHLKFRYRILKKEDPNHVVSVHSPCPTMYHGAWEPNNESATHLTGEMDHTIFHRGNDWDMADIVDALGTSNFPIFQKNDPLEYGGRAEMIRSATRKKKPCWISELQGGAVTAALQQVWLWTSYARGAKAVIFWNWRGEVFGRESSTADGIIGLDGNENSRRESFKKAGEILIKYGDLLDAYQPADPKTAVFFEESSWCIEWARTGYAIETFEDTIGYVRALEKVQIPYTFLESKHLDYLDQLHFLIMPNAKVISKEAGERIRDFVRQGGWILLEGDAESFLEQGFYQYLDERPFVNSFGIIGTGVRRCDFDDMTFNFNDNTFRMKAWEGKTWISFKATDQVETLSRHANGESMAIMASYGKGKVIYCGHLLGNKYYKDAYEDFEAFLKAIAVSARAMPELVVESKLPLQYRYGKSGDKNLLFLINSSEKQCIKIFIPSCRDGRIQNIANDEQMIATKKNDSWHLQMNVDALSYNILCWQ